MLRLGLFFLGEPEKHQTFTSNLTKAGSRASPPSISVPTDRPEGNSVEPAKIRMPIFVCGEKANDPYDPGLKTRQSPSSKSLYLHPLGSRAGNIFEEAGRRLPPLPEHVHSLPPLIFLKPFQSSFPPPQARAAQETKMHDMHAENVPV